QSNQQRLLIRFFPPKQKRAQDLACGSPNPLPSETQDKSVCGAPDGRKAITHASACFFPIRQRRGRYPVSSPSRSLPGLNLEAGETATGASRQENARHAYQGVILMTRPGNHAIALWQQLNSLEDVSRHVAVNRSRCSSKRIRRSCTQLYSALRACASRSLGSNWRRRQARISAAGQRRLATRRVLVSQAD